MQKRKIYIVSEVFYPVDTSTGYYLTEIATHLARGFEVTALSSAPADSKASCRHEEFGGVKIVRIGGMASPSASLFYRGCTAFSRAASMCVLLSLRLRRGDLVLVVTNPPVFPLAAAVASAVRSASLVLLVHDVYPNAAVVAGAIASGSLVARTWEVVQRFVYRHSKRIICLGRDMYALLAKSGATIKEKLVIVPNWAEVESIRTAERQVPKVHVFQTLRTPFVVLYAGNLGRTHDADVIVSVAELLSEEENIVVSVVAAGAQFERLIASLQSSCPGCLKLIALPTGRNCQSDTLATGDVVLITFKAGMGGISVPSRMYNAMAAGKPIIGVTDEDSELAQVIREDNIGWVVPPGDVQALLGAIRFASRSPELVADMGKRARYVARTRYCKEGILRRYIELIDDVFEEGEIRVKGK